ncbi:MAG: pentapeptide repeat-containing protein [Methylophilaceae bacterium]
MRVFKILLTLAVLSFSTITFTAESGEFDDHCTYALSKQVFKKTDCSINEVYKGQKYCFGLESSRDSFLLDPDNTIKSAKAFYAKTPDVARTKISQEDALAQIKSKTCDLSSRDAGYLIFNGMDLSHCNMKNVGFFGAELKGAKLIGANMQGAYLNLARIENADFSKSDLSNAIIFQPIFDKTIFKDANLTNARVIGSLGKVDMRGINATNGRFGLDIGNQPMGQMKFDSVGGNFEGANFEGADLFIAAFPFGNLKGANLRNTNLIRADLVSADLTGADLTGADLTGADVDNANFKDVKGLSTVKGFDKVKGKCNNCVATADQAEPAKTEAKKDEAVKVSENTSTSTSGPGCTM